MDEADLTSRERNPGSGPAVSLTTAVSRPQPAAGCQACGARGQSICAALSTGELPVMAAIRSDVRFAPNQTVFFEGDPADSLYNVKQGVVKLFKLLADGRTQITGFLFPGDFLGLALLNKYSYSCEAVTASELCRFPRVEFEALLDRFPALERQLLNTASNELAAAQDQMLLLGRKTAQERLATFLVLMRRRATSPTNPDTIILPMSRQDIGDYLGLTIETVSRTVTRLRKSGAIDLPDPHSFVVRDSEALAALSGLEEL